MLRNIIFALAGLIVLVVLGAYVFTPRMVHVERTITIAASPEEVFPYANDYTLFNEWSPWAHRDPDAEYEFTENTVGVGAGMTWSGDETVGSGRQEITLSEPYDRIETYLDFGSQGDAVAFFTFEEVEGGTFVTWGFDTDMGLNPIGRYMGLMMDTWVGGDYEEGLQNMKALIESRS